MQSEENQSSDLREFQDKILSKCEVLYVANNRILTVI